MKKYLFNYDQNIEEILNSLIVKRALKRKAKVEKMSELLRNLIIEENERTKQEK